MPRFSHHISRNEEVVRSDCSLWSFEASLAAVRNQPPPLSVLVEALVMVMTVWQPFFLGELVGLAAIRRSPPLCSG